MKKILLIPFLFVAVFSFSQAKVDTLIAKNAKWVYHYNKDSVDRILNGYIKQGGNSFGTDISIGTNDANSVYIKVNGVNRLGFDANGRMFNPNSGYFLQYFGSSSSPAFIQRNTNNTYSVFAFNNANASSTGNILDFQNQGTTLSYITNIGDFFSNKNSALSIGTQNSQPIIFVANGINQLAIDANRRIYSGAGANYGSITFGTASTTSNLLRNTADNFSVFAFNNANGSSTGHTVDFQNQGDTKSYVDKDGSFVSPSFKLTDLNSAPASATATGTKGEIRITSTYIYVCTATNTWVRAALSTW